MKYFLILICSTLLVGPLRAATLASATTHSTLQASTPEAEFNRLAEAMMGLVQRVLSATSDTEALAIMQKESGSLRKQAEQLRPQYATWLGSLNTRDAAGVRNRMQRSNFATYFGTLETDPQINARLRSNPKLGDAVSHLLNSLDMRAK